MKELTRRSMLQIKILLRLSTEPAKSIAGLAESLNSLRPSVSRSLHTLKEEGLVHRSSGAWRLTEVGRTEAFNAPVKLAETTEKVQAMAKHSVDIWNHLSQSGSLAKLAEPAVPGSGFMEAFSPVYREILKGMDSVLESATKNLAEAAMPSVKLGDIPGQDYLESLMGIASVAKSIGQSVIPSLPHEYFTGIIEHGLMTQALKSLGEIQERNASLLSQFAVSQISFPYDQVLQQTNLLLAGSIDSVFKLREAGMFDIGEQMSRAIDLSWVPSQVVNVSEAFGCLYREQTERFFQVSASVPSLRLAEEITLSAATVNHHTRSLLKLVEAETTVALFPLLERGEVEYGDESLDFLLGKLNPVFVEMRRGSWQRLNDNGLDRLRHAGTSQRELLRQLLRHFVPDFELPEGRSEGPQIKLRMKAVLGGSKSSAEFVDAMATAVFLYYGQLNKPVHENEKHEESLRALFRAGEGLIRFILAKSGISQDHK